MADLILDRLNVRIEADSSSLTRALDQALAATDRFGVEMHQSLAAGLPQIGALAMPAFDQLETRMLDLQGLLAGSMDRAANTMSDALMQFARTGEVNFDSLKTVALSALDQILQSVLGLSNMPLGGGFAGLFGGGSFGGMIPSLGNLFGGFLADGGPATAGRAYMVGELGPELFVPRQSGQILPNGSFGSGGTHVTVNLHGVRGAPEDIRRSGAQVAAAVSRAVARGQRNL